MKGQLATQQYDRLKSKETAEIQPEYEVLAISQAARRFSKRVSEPSASCSLGKAVGEFFGEQCSLKNERAKFSTKRSTIRRTR